MCLTSVMANLWIISYPQSHASLIEFCVGGEDLSHLLMPAFCNQCHALTRGLSSISLVLYRRGAHNPALWQLDMLINPDHY